MQVFHENAKNGGMTSDNLKSIKIQNNHLCNFISVPLKSGPVKY